MNAPCGACGSEGYLRRGTAPPWTLCRMCGRAWMPGLLHEPSFPPLSWWIEHRGTDPMSYGEWVVFEADTNARVSFELAATPFRSTALDLIQAFLNSIATKRDAGDLARTDTLTPDVARHRAASTSRTEDP